MGFCLGIDYLRFTVRGIPVEEVFEQLDGAPSKSDRGYHGYPVLWLVANESGTAFVATGATRNLREVHVDVPGGYLSGWSFERVQALAKWARSKGAKGTRVDNALDDRVGVVTISTVQRALERGCAVTHFRDMRRMHRLGLERAKDRKGDTIYVGSGQSQTLLRIYDKALEQQAKGRDVEGPWIRWELQLREERAQACLLALASLEADEYRRFIVGVLRSAIDFRATEWEADPMIRCRATPLRWWVTLTDGFQKARLMVEKAVRKLEDVKQ